MDRESTALHALESLLPDQPANPLRPNQVANYEEEIKRLDTLIAAPAYQGGDRPVARMVRQRLQKDLETQRPKPVDPSRKDQVASAAQEVLDTVIRPSMLSHAIMRRNPAGAVDQFLKRGEGTKTYKQAALAWKRARLALAHDNRDEQDLANLEQFRPAGTTEGAAATFMADAQIPGHFAMSPQARANWPLGEPTADTALKQAQRASEGPDDGGEGTTKTTSAAASPKRPHWTQKLTEAERKAFAEKMKASRKVKKT